MDPNREVPRWTRLPVLPRRFCIGITVDTAVFIIAWLFFVVGVIMLVGFTVGFVLHNYYTSEAEDIVMFTKLRLKMKIEEGFILSILITIGLSVGVVMDMFLLYALAKRRLRLQAAWAGALLARMVFWVGVGAMMWSRCIRGGRMCYVLLPASMMWASSLGVFSVVIVVTYSHIFYAYFDEWVASLQYEEKDVTSTTTTTTTTTSSEETSEEDSV